METTCEGEITGEHINSLVISGGLLIPSPGFIRVIRHRSLVVMEDMQQPQAHQLCSILKHAGILMA